MQKWPSWKGEIKGIEKVWLYLSSKDKWGPGEIPVQSHVMSLGHVFVEKKGMQWESNEDSVSVPRIIVFHM